jgi:hypothetical protein
MRPHRLAWMEGVSPKDLLLERAKTARDLANRQSRAKAGFIIALYFFGLMAIVGGATAAATAGRDDVATWIPVVAGALAAVGGGVSAGFRLEGRAYRHARAAADLHAVADDAANEHARLTTEGKPSDDASQTINKVQERLDQARQQTAFELGQSPDQVATAGDTGTDT